MNNDNYLRTPRERIVIGELTETSNGRKPQTGFRR